MPNPSIFLSPSRGAAGRDVTVQGFNYQPNQDLFIQVGGTIVSTEKAGPDGTFTGRLFIPISGQGAHSVAVLDASGNVAASSFFTEFGFDNLQRTSQTVDSDVRPSLRALLDAQTKAAQEARDRDRLVIIIAIIAAVAAALALVGASVAMVRSGRPPQAVPPAATP
ncbi:MAG: hypothetical protein FJ315_06370 [SAR202 cluster bacterium]|nr:hypothetical protein [SAR202 cluster bacterium]